MVCYYCSQANLNTSAVGICKECNVEACSSTQYVHGEKCTMCGLFYCHHHQVTHNNSKHNAKMLFKNFPKTTQTSLNIVIKGLENLSDKNRILVADYGESLADKFNDVEMRKEFLSISKEKEELKTLHELGSVKKDVTKLIKRLNDKAEVLGLSNHLIGK